MNSPSPIEELPSFIEKNYNPAQPIHNPWLKYIFVGGVIMMAFVISAVIIGKNQQNSITKKKEENEY
jgi:hypothetical protein